MVENRAGRRMSGPVPRTEPAAQLVIGWNDRPGSAAALAFAMDLAHRLTAHLHLVHILDLNDLPVDIDAPDWDEQLERTLDDEAREAKRRLDGLDAGWTYHAYRGSPAIVLADVADEFDALMVIVGGSRHGVGAFVEHAFGDSVSKGLIGERRRPVLVVPPTR